MKKLRFEQASLFSCHAGERDTSPFLPHQFSACTQRGLTGANKHVRVSQKLIYFCANCKFLFILFVMLFLFSS